MLNEGVRPSQVELGSHHQLTRNLVHRLERLGYTVTLEQKAACPLNHPPAEPPCGTGTNEIGYGPLVACELSQNKYFGAESGGLSSPE